MSNGQILAGGQYPSYFNREDSDGDIAVFRKDGSAVGSIGVESGDLKIGHNTAALDFLSSESRIRPWNMSTNLPNDNAVSLGRVIHASKTSTYQAEYTSVALGRLISWTIMKRGLGLHNYLRMLL